MKLLRGTLFLLGIASFAICLKAESFIVTLELEGAHTKQSTTNGVVISHMIAKPRPVFEGRVNEPLKVRYCFSPKSGAPMEDVLVHAYVTPESQLNQMSPPTLKSDVVILESALLMDFKTNHIAQASFSFKVNRPGIFLVRVEALDFGNSGLDEPFAALDLEIKENGAK